MNGGLKDVCVSQALLSALEDTFNANWRLPGYMSPQSFVCLLDSLIFMTYHNSRIFFTTKSSFVEWFRYIHSSSTYSASRQILPENAVPFIVGMIQQILYNRHDTLSWIEKSK